MSSSNNNNSQSDLPCEHCCGKDWTVWHRQYDGTDTWRQNLFCKVSTCKYHVSELIFATLWTNYLEYKVKIRNKISRIQESLNSFSGSFMLQYIYNCIGSVDEKKGEALEVKIRNEYNYNISRESFLKMCDSSTVRLLLLYYIIII